MTYPHLMGTATVAWLRPCMPALEYEKVKTLPHDVINLLYPNVAEFGPNGDNVRKFLNYIILWSRSVYNTNHMYDLRDISATQEIFRVSLPSRLQNNIWEAWNRSGCSDEHDLDDAVLRSMQMIAFDGIVSFAHHDVISQEYDELEKSYFAVFGLNPENYKWKAINEGSEL